MRWTAARMGRAKAATVGSTDAAIAAPSRGTRIPEIAKFLTPGYGIQSRASLW